MADIDMDLDISYGTVKEEGGYTMEPMNDEGEEEEEEAFTFPANNEGSYRVGQNLINFDNVDDEDDIVPDHDPLSFDNEDEDIVVFEGANEPDAAAQNLVILNDNEDDEILPIQVQVQGQNVVHAASTASMIAATRELIFKEVEVEKPIMIKSVSSLFECRVGPSCEEADVASFKSLDVFRCYYCRLNYFVEDDLLRHRKAVMPGVGLDMHPNKTYNPDLEKPFACGVCGKPWNQPRKALACAIFGHDPQTLYWAMFRHDCPMCSEQSLRFHSLAAVARHWVCEHPEKPLPAFLLKDWKNDVLPTIKLTKQHFDSVGKGPMFYIDCGKKRPLVIENFPPNHCRKRTSIYTDIQNKKAKTDPSALKNTKAPKKIKPYRCVSCLQLVSGTCQTHTCPRRPDGKVVFPCPRCKARFTDKRTLKLHLMNYCSCFSSPESQTVIERCPYVCIVCKMRFGSFQDLKMHRSLTHVHIPFQPDKELPFTCTVCGRPAMIEKEARLCEVFGHDPYTIKKVMFNFRCGECPSNAFGFHSNYALRKHWEKAHGRLKLPEKLAAYTEEDVPLPSVTLTLEQLLICAENRKHENPVNEFEFDLSSDKQDFILKTNLNCQSVTFQVQQIIITDELTNSATPNKIIHDNDRNKCELCGLSFKNLRRHMKVHDEFRYSGEPKHKCGGCGKKYYIRNSLIHHWKTHGNCKMIQEQKMTSGVDSEIPEITLDDSDDEAVTVVKKSSAPLPPTLSTLPVIENKTLKAAPVISSTQLDQALALMGDDFFGESAPVPASKTLTLHYGENSGPVVPAIRLSSVPQIHIPNEVALPESEVEVAENQKLEDVSDEIEIGEVKFACDSASFSEGAHTAMETPTAMKPIENELASQMEGFLTRKPVDTRPVRCTLCNLIYPDKIRWMSHMDEFHADAFPYKCEHCGKRFNDKWKLSGHSEIHKPGRFEGEPKFVCQTCGKKYHLAGSLSTHISNKHMGKKFKSNLAGPILLPRPHWARNPRAKRFSCHKCPRKFAYKVFMIQHVWREHVGKVEGGAIWKKKSSVKREPNVNRKGPHVCQVCKKEFPTNFKLKHHTTIHTGEKPHKCLQCGAGFREKFNLRKHINLVHENGGQRKKARSTNPISTSSESTECPKQKLEQIDQAKEFKCIVCGVLFQWATDLRKHRIIKHGNFPSDQEKTKPFGCGVCGKPYLRRSQAITCALFEHDPTSLLQDMFKHQCAECPEGSFGYHSLTSLKKHWLKEHAGKGKEMPEELDDLNVEENDPFPSVVVDEEKVKEIMEKGVPKMSEYPLVKEFELLQPPNSNKPELVLPPPVRIRPTPPIRIKNVRTRSDVHRASNVKFEPEKSAETPDFDVNIDSVMSPADSPFSPSEELTEVEVEDMKPFIQFIPETLESQTPSSSLYEPKDNNIDINEGIPVEFQMRRTSARVSKMKLSKQGTISPGDSQSSAKKVSSKVKPQTQSNSSNRTLRQKAPLKAEVINATKQAPPPLPPPSSSAPKNGKVQLKEKSKSNSRRKKVTRAKRIQQEKESKVEKVRRLSASITELEKMPIISTECAQLALSSLKTSPMPRLEPEVNKETPAPIVKKLDLETPKTGKTSGPAILKLLRRTSQASNSSASSPATPTPTEEKTDSDSIPLNSPSSIPPALGSPCIPQPLNSPSSMPPSLSSPPIISSPLISPSLGSPPNLLPCSVSIHDHDAVEKILGRKNLQISVDKIESSETNAKRSKPSSGSVSALVLQLRNKKRQVREEDAK